MENNEMKRHPFVQTGEREKELELLRGGNQPNNRLTLVEPHDDAGATSPYYVSSSPTHTTVLPTY